MKIISWYLKQLLPMGYYSTYKKDASGRKYITVWRQWLGMILCSKTYEIMPADTL